MQNKFAAHFPLNLDFVLNSNLHSYTQHLPHFVSSEQLRFILHVAFWKFHVHDNDASKHPSTKQKEAPGEHDNSGIEAVY